MFHLKAYKIKGINSKQLLPVWFSEFFFRHAPNICIYSGKTVLNNKQLPLFSLPTDMTYTQLSFFQKCM